MALRFAFSVQATRARFRFHTRSAFVEIDADRGDPADLATFQSRGAIIPSMPIPAYDIEFAL